MTKGRTRTKRPPFWSLLILLYDLTALLRMPFPSKSILTHYSVLFATSTILLALLLNVSDGTALPFSIFKAERKTKSAGNSCSVLQRLQTTLKDFEGSKIIVKHDKRHFSSFPSRKIWNPQLMHSTSFTAQPLSQMLQESKDFPSYEKFQLLSHGCGLL